MRPRASAAISLLALAACALAVGLSAASFTDTKQNSLTASAASDFLPPTASASTIAKTPGTIPGYVKKSGTYYVYANVTDSGNPGSGVASVKADVSSLTTGQTAVSLVAGTYSVGGASYNYRSAQLTANATLSEGVKTYTLALLDSAGNPGSSEGSVMVDNSSFKGADFETVNGAGGTEGKPEKGDVVRFEFNKAPDPNSIVANWDGSGSKSVTVTISDNAANDTLAIGGATLGTAALKGDFTASSATFSGSTMSLSGSTVTVVLGTASGSITTEDKKTKATWTPSSSVYDAAGNASATTAAGGSNVKQF